MRINVASSGVRINVGATSLGSHGDDARFGPHGGGPYKPLEAPPVPPLYTIEVVDTSDICTYDPTAMTLKPNGSGRTGTVLVNVAARGSKFVTTIQLDVALVGDDLGIPVCFIPLPPAPATKTYLTAAELEAKYDIKLKPLPPKVAPVGPVNRRVGKPDLRPLPFVERRYAPIDLRGKEAADKLAAEKAASSTKVAYSGTERRHGAVDTRPLPQANRRV
jgi:hypothetical protein